MVSRDESHGCPAVIGESLNNAPWKEVSETMFSNGLIHVYIYTKWSPPKRKGEVQERLNPEGS